MISIDPNDDETFFSTTTFPRKNGMPDSLSSLLVFIATICLAFTLVMDQTLEIHLQCPFLYG